MDKKLNRRERRAQQFGPAYKFRSLPCSIQPDEKLWCVSGQYYDASGVLEWCYDQKDAEAMLAKMRQHRGFRNLSAQPFLEGYKPPSNPNNCDACDHYRTQRHIEDTKAEANYEKLHCYMFKDEPTDICMQHSHRTVSPMKAMRQLMNILQDVGLMADPEGEALDENRQEKNKCPL